MSTVNTQAEDIVTDPILTFEGHTSEVNSVAFSPDGQMALSGSGYYDDSKDKHIGEIKLWNLSTGKLASAEQVARLSITYAEQSGDLAEQMHSHACLATVLHCHELLPRAPLTHENRH